VDGSLPALGSQTRPVGIGRRTRDGKDVPEVRAFLATVRNRGDADMWIVEGDGDDRAMIRPGESYHVPAVDGTDKLQLAADVNNYSDYEIRTIEGHNDFSLVDRVEGFVQSIAMLLRSARTTTTISGQEVPITIDDANGLNIDVADGVTIPVEATNSVNTQIEGIDGGVTLPVSIDATTANVDTTLTAADVTLPVSIDASNVALDTQITGSSIPIDANISGADVSLSTEIVGQVGNIQTVVNENVETNVARQFAEFVRSESLSESGTYSGTLTYGVGVTDDVILQVRTEAHDITIDVSYRGGTTIYIRGYVGPPDTLVSRHKVGLNLNSNKDYTFDLRYSTGIGWEINKKSGGDWNRNGVSANAPADSRLGKGDYIDYEIEFNTGRDIDATTNVRFDGVNR